MKALDMVAYSGMVWWLGKQIPPLITLVWCSQNALYSPIPTYMNLMNLALRGKQTATSLSRDMRTINQEEVILEVFHNQKNNFHLVRERVRMSWLMAFMMKPLLNGNRRMRKVSEMASTVSIRDRDIFPNS